MRVPLTIIVAIAVAVVVAILLLWAVESIGLLG
jgi:hypothetical protein